MPRSGINQQCLRSSPNIFRIPDCASGCCLPWPFWPSTGLGSHIPTAGGQRPPSSSCLFNQQSGSALGHDGSVWRRQPAPHDRVCSRHHAVHSRRPSSFSCSPSSMSRWRASRRRRAGAPADYAVGTRYLTVILGALQSIGIASYPTRAARPGADPEFSFTLMTMLNTHHGHGIHHLAGRTELPIAASGNGHEPC